ncbi:MAG TPA: MBL fold metallo-hydrolase, partial [Planctomycetota bacterium]|nr:MBL fold metallo-hydrolase [Planctomycetota bacterium]
ALVACPTASIGTVSRLDARPGVEAFPEPIEDEVHYCGFTSEDSFGGSSYLILRPEGNVLVDSPRAAEPLLRRIEALGGVSLMLLTHRDDVADHEKIARRFGAERVMHEADVDADTAGVERKLGGGEVVELAPGLLAIPTPGHTRGHTVFLWREKFLFTGDHLEGAGAEAPAGSKPFGAPARRSRAGSAGRLDAFRDYCWYSWREQIRSMARLEAYRFEWVLPGHGGRFHAPEAEMRAELARCVARMQEAA